MQTRPRRRICQKSRLDLQSDSLCAPQIHCARHPIPTVRERIPAVGVAERVGGLPFREVCAVVAHQERAAEALDQRLAREERMPPSPKAVSAAAEYLRPSSRRPSSRAADRRPERNIVGVVLHGRIIPKTAQRRENAKLPENITHESLSIEKVSGQGRRGNLPG